MKKILFLLLIPLMFLPVALAQKPNGSGFPYVWFVSWTGSSSLPATGNVTFDFGGFWWADEQLSTIQIHADWGDGAVTDRIVTGTLDPMFSSPTYDGFSGDLNHNYYRIGSYGLTISLLDLNGNFDQKSVLIIVGQGPNLPTGVYGAGARAPVKM